MGKEIHTTFSIFFYNECKQERTHSLSRSPPPHTKKSLLTNIIPLHLTSYKLHLSNRTDIFTVIIQIKPGTHSSIYSGLI